MAKKPRDYKAEYRYHATAKQRADRSARNKARRAAMKKGLVRKGDGKDVHHVRPLAKRGSRTGPTQVVPKGKNRSFPRTRGAKMK